MATDFHRGRTVGPLLIAALLMIVIVFLLIFKSVEQIVFIKQ